VFYLRRIDVFPRSESTFFLRWWWGK